MNSKSGDQKMSNGNLTKIISIEKHLVELFRGDYEVCKVWKARKIKLNKY